jgi:PD-(D/E)XK nuclease superfamily
MPRALTWSMSRAGTLEACERRYFFEYVVGARRNSRDPRLRTIAGLKRLKTLAMWQGEVFHTLAGQFFQALRAGRHPTHAQLAAAAALVLEDGWRTSSLGTPEGVGLFEHSYATPLDPDALGRTVERVGTWLGRLTTWAYEADLATTLARARRIWIEPPAFGPSAPGFLLDGTQVLTKVDLALQKPDGTFVIYDWKTTQQPPAASAEFTDAAEVQVTVYQLWPHRAFGVPLAAITAQLIYVGVDPVLARTFAIDGDISERTVRRVGAGIRRAHALHGLGDHAPLAEADFDLAAAPGMCRWCAFKRVCQEDLSDDMPSEEALGAAVGDQEEFDI